MAITTTNPATGEVERTFEALGEAEIEDRLGRAATAFEGYRSTSLRVRAAWMNGAADILEQDLDDVAEVVTREMGKTIVAARGEVGKCAAACRFYAERAEEFL